VIDFQQSILEAIQTIAGERIKNVSFTRSYTGVVKSIDGLMCIVDYNGNDQECIIPHNLQNFVGKDDLVIIQDITNDNITRIIQGVIDSNGTIFNIYDPIDDVIVSSVLQLWDEDLQKPIDAILELE
jgi:hypothetical protein